MWFDFGQPKKLSKTEFEKTFGHLRFDRALQYVALPQVELFDEDDSDDEDGVVATRTPDRGRKVCLDTSDTRFPNFMVRGSNTLRTWFPSSNGSRKRESSILSRYGHSLFSTRVREALRFRFTEVSTRLSWTTFDRHHTAMKLSRIH